jgi:hypothetical protein
MTMTTAELKNQLEQDQAFSTNSEGPFYSKKDVLEIIKIVENNAQKDVFWKIKEQLVHAITDDLDSEFNRSNIDFVDTDSFSFGIDYNNKIQVEDFDINVDDIVDVVARYVDKLEYEDLVSEN